MGVIMNKSERAIVSLKFRSMKFQLADIFAQSVEDGSSVEDLQSQIDFARKCKVCLGVSAVREERLDKLQEVLDIITEIESGRS